MPEECLDTEGPDAAHASDCMPAEHASTDGPDAAYASDCTPEAQEPILEFPVSDVFLAVAEKNDRVECKAYGAEDRCAVFSFAVPCSGTALFAEKIGRFSRYGQFQYPSIMWRLQEMGIEADRRGDTKSGDLIYAEFIKTFDEYIRCL
jgi:hypothetical protein